MMDVMEAIRERRSIRKYEDRNIPEDVLSHILESVRWSPSWANTQCWDIIVVTDNKVKEDLQGSLPPKGNPAFKAIVAAPVLLVICGKLNTSGFYKDIVTTKFGDWFMFDLGIAAQNICLAAQSYGLGTVIVGLFDHDKAKKVLNVPEDHELVAMIPMGYPAKKSSAPKRREVEEYTHDNKF